MQSTIPGSEDSREQKTNPRLYRASSSDHSLVSVRDGRSPQTTGSTEQRLPPNLEDLALLGSLLCAVVKGCTCVRSHQAKLQRQLALVLKICAQSLQNNFDFGKLEEEQIDRSRQYILRTTMAIRPHIGARQLKSWPPATQKCHPVLKGRAEWREPVRKKMVKSSSWVWTFSLLPYSTNTGQQSSKVLNPGPTLRSN